MSRQKAFTLIEIVTAVVMGALVLAGLGSVFAGTIKLWNRVQDSTAVLNSGNMAMQWLTRDLREAKEAEIISNGINITIAGDNGEDQIILYTVNGSTLNRDGETVAEGVTSCTFVPESSNFISVFLTIRQGSRELDFQNGACLRNFEET